MTYKYKIPIIVISAIVAVIVVILIIFIIINSGGSSTIASSTPTSVITTTDPTSNTIPSSSPTGSAPIVAKPILKQAPNTTLIVNVGGVMYYLLCLTNIGYTYPGSSNEIFQEIESNSNVLGNYVGNVNFWDNLVTGMMSELGKNVAIGSSNDFKTNFIVDPGYLCTQFNIGYLSQKICLLNSSDGNVTNAKPLLDYTCAIYVADGILIPPKPKFSYNNASYPTYHPSASISTSWTFIPSSGNNLYTPNVNMYGTQFILLKTNGSSGLDKSLKSQGYYANTGVWDSSSAKNSISGNLGPSTLLLSPSFFPPFTKIM